MSEYENKCSQCGCHFLDVHKRSVVCPSCKRIAELERKQHQSDLNYDALEKQLEKKERENAELRKDAERYRWIRSQHWDTSDMFVIVKHPSQRILGSECPSMSLLDEKIDAAMAMMQMKDIYSDPGKARLALEIALGMKGESE